MSRHVESNKDSASVLVPRSGARKGLKGTESCDYTSGFGLYSIS